MQSIPFDVTKHNGKLSVGLALLQFTSIFSVLFSWTCYIIFRRLVKACEGASTFLLPSLEEGPFVEQYLWKLRCLRACSELCSTCPEKMRGTFHIDQDALMPFMRALVEPTAGHHCDLWHFLVRLITWEKEINQIQGHWRGTVGAEDKD